MITWFTLLMIGHIICLLFTVTKKKILTFLFTFLLPFILPFLSLFFNVKCFLKNKAKIFINCQHFHNNQTPHFFIFIYNFYSMDFTVWFFFYFQDVIWRLWLKKTSKRTLSKLVQQVLKFLNINFHEPSLNGYGVMDFFVMILKCVLLFSF